MLLCLATVAGLHQASAQVTGPLKLGVLTDMSSLYADNGGPGSVVAAQMAVDDYGGSVLGRKVEIISGDHQNKADVGTAITRRWIDNENVEAILDVPNSAVALAVQGIAREKNRALVGRELEVLVEGASEDHELVMKGRHAGQAPEIDGSVYLSEGEAHAGEMRKVRVVQASDWDLVGELVDEPSPSPGPAARPRVSLKVLGAGAEPRWR